MVVMWNTLLWQDNTHASVASSRLILITVVLVSLVGPHFEFIHFLDVLIFTHLLFTKNQHNSFFTNISPISLSGWWGVGECCDGWSHCSCFQLISFSVNLHPSTPLLVTLPGMAWWKTCRWSQPRPDQLWQEQRIQWAALHLTLHFAEWGNSSNLQFSVSAS